MLTFFCILLLPCVPHVFRNKDDFDKKYGRNKYGVETQVQQAFHDELRGDCLNAQSQVKRMQYHAKTQRKKADREHMMEAAANIDTTSCDE